MQIDSATMIGIIGILLVQIGQTWRTFITSKTAKNQNAGINLELQETKEALTKLVDINKKEHEELVKSMQKIDERQEHASFIPSFEIAIETYINNVVNGFSFSHPHLSTLALSAAMKYKDIFTGILKFGFNKFSSQFLKSNFDVQDMRLVGILESHKIEIDQSALKEIIQSEGEEFIIKINNIIQTKTNGARQEAFNNLCKSFIFTTIKEISKL